MKTTITFETFEELAAAFSKAERGPKDRYPILNAEAHVVIDDSWVRLTQARDNGTAYEYGAYWQDFLLACCRRIGIRTADDLSASEPDPAALPCDDKPEAL